MIFTQHAQSFANYLKSYLPPEISNGHDFLKGVSDELTGLEQLATLEVCVKRVNHLQLTINPEHLKERLLVLDGNRILIAGVRYKALDPNFPFIEVRPNFTINQTSLAEIKTIILKEFQSVSPKGLKVQHPPGLNLGWETWSSILFGSTGQHQAETKLRVHWPLDFNSYETYRTEYLKTLDRNSHLKGIVRIEPEEDLKEAAALGLLMEIRNDHNQFLGLIAGSDTGLYGLKAIYIFELFLVTDYQGKGLAPEMQRTFLKHLSQQYSHVWGHISSINQPSLRTALRSGRKIIQTEYYLSF